MKINLYHNQQGATLIISLVILIALTLVGITSMQSSRTELSMAGNQREAGLMFQAAEMGLITAENFVENSTSKGVFAQPNLGLFTVDAGNTSYDTPDYFNDSDWDSQSQTADTSIHGLEDIEQPRFKVEYLGDRDNNPQAIAVTSYTDPGVGDIVSIYRATARGRGLTGNSYRYVQSYYGKDTN